MGKKKKLNTFGRALAFVILLLAIWGASNWGIANVKSEIESLNGITRSNPMSADGFNIFEHLSEATRS